jgi:hypothetical protein
MKRVSNGPELTADFVAKLAARGTSPVDKYWHALFRLSNEYEKVIVLSEASSYYSNDIGIRFAQLYNSTLETKQNSKLTSENMLVGSGPQDTGRSAKRSGSCRRNGTWKSSRSWKWTVYCKSRAPSERVLFLYGHFGFTQTPGLTHVRLSYVHKLWILDEL